LIKNTNVTGSRILYLLNLFLEKRELSMDEIIHSFSSIDIVGEICCKDSVIKYINTLKKSGYVIVRKNKKYSLEQVPQNIEESESFLETLIKIEALSKFIYTKKSRREAFSIINDVKILISKNSKEDLKDFLKDEQDLAISKDEKAILNQCEKICTEEQRVLFLYLAEDGNLTEMTCEPYDIIYKNRQVYINVFDLKDFDKKLINIKFIKKIKQLPTKSQFNQQSKNAKLMLMDKLAKSYTLKENEKIIQKNDRFIVISTIYNDKTQFVKRILRYGELCKIVSPASLQESYLNYLAKMIISNS
jgi:predicted DNA-binding transcriptional regulator YafY